MLNIRPATKDDVGLILEFIYALAEYEREPHSVKATEADLLRDGFGPEPRYRCLIAEQDGNPAAFALYFYNYSTWRGRAGIYLEDIFVKPEFRKRGIGKALLLHLAKLAVEQQCGRFEWAVLDWNKPAIHFYESLGAVRMSEWLPMRT
ncbi:MAG TPA: GNAT family N-acetyltransferase, partial [Terriglobales bacterium]